MNVNSDRSLFNKLLDELKEFSGLKLFIIDSDAFTLELIYLAKNRGYNFLKGSKRANEIPNSLVTKATENIFKFGVEGVDYAMIEIEDLFSIIDLTKIEKMLNCTDLPSNSDRFKYSIENPRNKFSTLIRTILSESKIKSQLGSFDSFMSEIICNKRILRVFNKKGVKYADQVLKNSIHLEFEEAGSIFDLSLSGHYFDSNHIGNPDLLISVKQKPQTLKGRLSIKQREIMIVGEHISFSKSKSGKKYADSMNSSISDHFRAGTNIIGGVPSYVSIPHIIKNSVNSRYDLNISIVLYSNESSKKLIQGTRNQGMAFSANANRNVNNNYKLAQNWKKGFAKLMEKSFGSQVKVGKIVKPSFLFSEEMNKYFGLVEKLLLNNTGAH